MVADVARKYLKETIRSTVEQNLVLRWVSEADLPALYTELKQAGSGAPVAGTIVDVSSCPGTDTCKLGIASSRGLAGELRMRLAAKNAELDEAIGGLRIKISGCFNSCGQHHVADLGFYGVSRNKNGYTVPHFQVLLGGEWQQQRRRLRARDRRGAFQTNSRNGRSHHGPLSRGTPAGRNFPGVHQAHRQSRMQEDDRRVHRRSAA